MPQVDIGHLHHPKVSVRAQVQRMLDILQARDRVSFAELTRDCESQMHVVASFMGLLLMFGDRQVEFEQPAPLENLTVVRAA